MASETNRRIVLAKTPSAYPEERRFRLDETRDKTVEIRVWLNPSIPAFAGIAGLLESEAGAAAGAVEFDADAPPSPITVSGFP